LFFGTNRKNIFFKNNKKLIHENDICYGQLINKDGNKKDLNKLIELNSGNSQTFKIKIIKSQ
jgi:hypothetical protein